MKRFLVTTLHLTLVALALSVGFGSANAQEITGTISGTIKDSNGGPLRSDRILTT